MSQEPKFANSYLNQKTSQFKKNFYFYYQICQTEEENLENRVKLYIGLRCEASYVTCVCVCITC